MQLESCAVATKRTLEFDLVQAAVLLVLAMVGLEDVWGWNLGLEERVVAELVLGDVGVEKGSEELVVV